MVRPSGLGVVLSGGLLQFLAEFRECRSERRREGAGRSLELVLDLVVLHRFSERIGDLVPGFGQGGEGLLDLLITGTSVLSDPPVCLLELPAKT